jgi:hypothetical protein
MTPGQILHTNASICACRSRMVPFDWTCYAVLIIETGFKQIRRKK